MDKTCESCQWWEDAGLVAQTKSSVLHGSEKGSLVELGYCEPLIGPMNHGWKGLTASDYTCGEWQEKPE